MKQRVNKKFCFKLGKMAATTHRMLMQVYGVEAVSKNCVFLWFKHLERKVSTVHKHNPRQHRKRTTDDRG